VIWDALEFRTPAMLRIIEPLTQGELEWQPPNDANSIAWLLWHIAEVEDNWIRDRLLGLERRYPFGVSVKSSVRPPWPSKDELLAYFHEARALSRERLERSTIEDFDRVIIDEHFGRITVRQLWSGVATSGAWHGGQIVYIANRLVPRPAAG
jgi:uncharacterized damage-inducible protein DinB